MLNVNVLNQLYRDGESADKDVHAEMRSNVLLTIGDHYKRRTPRDTRRDGRREAETKLRLTKNHCHKAKRRYVNSILQFAGTVRVAPQNEEETQDRKDAELNDSVLSHLKNYLKFKKRKKMWARDFFTLGEVTSVVKWNPRAGDIRGYEQLIDESGQPVFQPAMDENGQPVMEPEVDEMGMPYLDEFGQPLMRPVMEPVPDMNKPQYKGRFELHDWYAYNVLRAPSAKTMDASPYLIHKELHDTKTLRRKYKEDEDALKAINNAADEKDYIEFNSTNGSFRKTENKTLVKECYIRPNSVVEGKWFPRGYFYLYTCAGILEEGELPFGIWPVASTSADDYTSDPRGRSPLRQVRPVQAEINRANSQMALHQVTIGDDKILYMNGTKLAPGALLPGVRGITYAGAQPTVLPGRDGSQYLPYLNYNKEEFYDLIDVNNIEMSKDDKGGYDVFSLLYREAKQKQAMSEYSDKFQEFLQDLCWTLLELARKYLPDDEVIAMAGRKEVVNIEEFRKTTPLHYMIKVEPQDETIETKFGRQLTLQHILQYTGQNLSREDVGQLVKNMPFANVKNQFRSMTVHEDAIENEILALERGEDPEVIAEMNHTYANQRLSLRMTEADFKYLDPSIQQAFYKKRQEHSAYIEQQLEAERAMKNEFIPVDGPMVKADVYVQDPNKPDKAPQRARIPQRALEWLIQRLEQQGAPLEKLEQMNGAALQELAEVFLGQQGGAGQQLPPGMPAGPMPAM